MVSPGHPLRQAALLLAVAAALGLPATARAATPWTVAAVPATPLGSTLARVTAISPSNAWAGGMRGDGQPLLMHWTGSAWTSVSAPAIPGYGYLTGISADSAADVWAVGNANSGPLILHRGTSHWSVFSKLPGKTFTLDAVSATSPTDVWVTGTWYDNAGDTYEGLFRWNGTTWSLKWKGFANPDQGISLPGLVALSEHNVWAVGERLYTDGTVQLAVHWKGHAATTDSAFPVNTVDYGFQLNGVAASTASNVWAVGGPANYYSDDFSQEYLSSAAAGVYNGSEWLAEMPKGYQDSSQHWFNAVATASPTSVWAVGNRAPAAGGSQSNLLEFWNGSSWAEYGGPNPNATNWLTGVAYVPGSSGQYWAVGSTGGDGGTDHPMILRCCS
jgi:hypothetical protein